MPRLLRSAPLGPSSIPPCNRTDIADRRMHRLSSCLLRGLAANSGTRSFNFVNTFPCVRKLAKAGHLRVTDSGEPDVDHLHGKEQVHKGKTARRSTSTTYPPSGHGLLQRKR